MEQIESPLRDSGYFLDIRSPTLEDVLKERAYSSPHSQIWENVTLSDMVVYCPRGPNLFIPGRVIKSYPLKVVSTGEGEFFLNRTFFERLGKGCSFFPKNSKWIETSNLLEYFSDLVTDRDVVIKYGKSLKKLGIDWTEIYVLSKNYVESQRAPFLRRMLLKGIKSKNLNKGRLCANVFLQ